MAQFLITSGAYCIKLLPEKNSRLAILTIVLSYGKVNGKIMLTGIFRFYQSFFSDKSYMQ